MAPKWKNGWEPPEDDDGFWSVDVEWIVVAIIAVGVVWLVYLLAHPPAPEPPAGAVELLPPPVLARSVQP